MLEIFITSIGSAALVAVALWLSRTWIRERLTASIRLETEKKLAILKSELETTTQRIRDISSAGTAASAQAEAVLVDLANNAATAKHIASKLARHFVSDKPPESFT